MQWNRDTHYRLYGSPQTHRLIEEDITALNTHTNTDSTNRSMLFLRINAQRFKKAFTTVASSYLPKLESLYRLSLRPSSCLLDVC